MPQRKSETFRHGITDNEEYMARAFELMGVRFLIRQAVFCFHCGNWFSHDLNQMPKRCCYCKTPYLQRGDWARPDMMIPDPAAEMISAVIYINSEKYHRSKKRQRAKDKDQIEKFRRFKAQVYIIDNEEIDKMRHANRCLLALGIKQAINVEENYFYELAYKDEKELLP